MPAVRLSIIMPTFNSAKTISFALDSLRRQTFTGYELLVVDGGSTDDTIAIARDFGAVVLENERRQPEYAKLIGINAARGRYAMFLDSDEALVDDRSLERKIELLEREPSVKNVITAGLVNPSGYPLINDYANRYGEPFSYFMYRLDGGDYVQSFRRKYRAVVDEGDYLIVRFGPNDVLPICDGGGHCFDLDYLKSIADTRDLQTIPLVFSLMAARTKSLGVIRGDFTTHYSSSTLDVYISKLKWRIRGNAHRLSGTEGYVNREALEPASFRLRKFAFVPYSLSIVGPLIDALAMARRRGSIKYLIHLPLTVFTGYYIAYQLVLKLLGIRPQLGNYGS